MVPHVQGVKEAVGVGSVRGRGVKGPWWVGLLFFVLSQGGMIPGVGAKTVTLPLTVDYPLLHSLIVKQAYPAPGRRALLLDEGSGCRRIVLSEPSIVPEGTGLLFETRVSVRLGVRVGDRCLSPVDWEGYVRLRQRPEIRPPWILGFFTLNSEVLDKDRRPGKVATVIWEALDSFVISYLEGIRIDLGVPAAEVKAFLGASFPPALGRRAERLLGSLRPGPVRVGPEAVGLDILVDVEETGDGGGTGEREKRLDRDEIEAFVSLWETWDAFLVALLTSLAKEPLEVEERQVFLDTLLEARYRFMAELSRDRGGKDFVREEFLGAWKRLSKIFRSHLGRDPSRSLLSYLAFFSASDALVALDVLGPSLGIEISRDGLIRLIRLVRAGVAPTLAYTPGPDRVLRETLGMAPGPDAPVSQGLDFEMDIEAPNGGDRGPDPLRLPLVLLGPCEAVAAEAPPPQAEEIRSWVPQAEDPMAHVHRVREALGQAAEALLRTRPMDEEMKDLFRDIALATGWQESCYRQFVRKGNKLVYLRSYNGTSVGVMQINERVWRGMYDEKALRWDIRYNLAAGCEILETYLSRYVLGKRKAKGAKALPGEEILARGLYAMYNSGPGDWEKFLERNRKGALLLTDKLFFEKWKWVEKDAWENVRQCLVGN